MTVLSYCYMEFLPSEYFLLKLIDALSHGKRVEAAMLKNKQKMWESLVGKILLMESMKAFGLEGNAIFTVQRDNYDRPYIPNNNFDFNITHSNGLISLISSNTSKVGIDVEKVCPLAIDDFVEVLNSDEFLAAKYDITEFYKIWTIKEAVLKANGYGLYLHLKNVLINSNHSKATCLGKDWYLKRLHLIKGFECCFAMENMNTKVTINRFYLEELISMNVSY
jgi:4'-phosphopantetheinyl transferase